MAVADNRCLPYQPNPRKFDLELCGLEGDCGTHLFIITDKLLNLHIPIFCYVINWKLLRHFFLKK
jgi:hypothetical protein